MSNLYADSNMYITEVTETTGDPHTYSVSWNYTSNNTLMDFTVLANTPITNVASTGKVISLGQNAIPADKYAENNTFTTVNISPKSTSNTGTGLTLQLSVAISGAATYNIVDTGAGYNVGDIVVFDKNDTHRSELVVGGDSTGKDVDVSLLVDATDKMGLEYFPPGLSDASVVANAVPLMNLEYGFSS